jgi:hypothetical protein
MSDRVAVNEEECGYAIAKLAETQYDPVSNVNFARLIDEEVVGGVIFSNYTGESIQMHVGAATPYWINRDMLWIAFDYPFNQLLVKRIFGHTPENFTDALQFSFKVGFIPIARIEGVFLDDTACIITRMDREDCRFLNIRPRTLMPGVSTTLQ